jgi:hypothetical protein
MILGVICNRSQIMHLKLIFPLQNILLKRKNTVAAVFDPTDSQDKKLDLWLGMDKNNYYKIKSN